MTSWLSPCRSVILTFRCQQSGQHRQRLLNCSLASNATTSSPPDPGRFQLLVRLELTVDRHDHCAQVRQVVTLQHVTQSVIADGLLQAQEVLPPPAQCLTLELQQRRHTQHRSQKQAPGYRHRRDDRKLTPISHPVQSAAQVEDLVDVVEELAQSIQDPTSLRGSPRRSNSKLICESSSKLS